MQILERFQLKGKVVLLTGAAGIYGRGLAKDISQAGATLVIASRQLEPLQKMAEELNEEGGTVEAVQLDQAEESSVLVVRDHIVQKYGRLDGLVNNAAARPMKQLTDPIENWDESLKVNGRGIFLMTRAFGEIMCEKNSGSIVNIGSIYGVLGPTLSFYEGTDMIGPPDYFFHKGGMRNLTKYFAACFGRHNVRVNCVNAGGFLSNQTEAFLKKYHASTFLGRMADKEDLGGPVVFLLSPASSYITGSDVAVDGGFSAH